MGCRTVGSTVLVVVGLVPNVNLCVDVTLVRFTVAVLFDTDLGLSVGTRRALFFVDVDVLFSVSWTTVAVVFCYSDLLFKAAGRRCLG